MPATILILEFGVSGFPFSGIVFFTYPSPSISTFNFSAFNIAVASFTDRFVKSGIVSVFSVTRYSVAADDVLIFGEIDW